MKTYKFYTEITIDAENQDSATRMLQDLVPYTTNMEITDVEEIDNE